MNRDSSYGGFFGLEGTFGQPFMPDTLYLNSARNCLTALFRTNPVETVHIPYFCCGVVRDSIEKAGAKVCFYHVDEKLEISPDAEIPQHAVILYVNYFGIKSAYATRLAQHFPRMVLDNSQALYSKARGTFATVYSPRKFMGVPDAGLLDTALPVNISDVREDCVPLLAHLVRRIDLSPEETYLSFLNAECLMSKLTPKRISGFSERLLDTINHQEIIDRRSANANLASLLLGQFNALSVPSEFAEPPLCYPLYIPSCGNSLRKKLINKRIFIATYWPEVRDECAANSCEHSFVDHLLPIPIDQRYSLDDVNKCCNSIIDLIRVEPSLEFNNI